MSNAKATRYRENEESSQDSFLDVVANVVGVLIILVMVVGLQASSGLLREKSDPTVQMEQSPSASSMEELAQLRTTLEGAAKQAIVSRQEIKNLSNRAWALRRETAAQDRLRVQLAMHRKLIKDDIEIRREQLDVKRQEEFDVQRQIQEAQLQLDDLAQEKLTIVSNPTTIKVESVPTPLAKVVDGPAIHLRLRHGLVSIIPYQQLTDEVQLHLDGMRRRLQNQSEIEDMFGPVDGYRLKFSVLKYRGVGAVTGPIAGHLERSQVELLGEFLPIAEKMGQHVSQAIMPGAALHNLLASERRTRMPIVVWLYTDSFDEFRILKRELWEMGLAVAIRPLEPGGRIRFSSRGTKASAQ